MVGIKIFSSESLSDIASRTRNMQSILVAAIVTVALYNVNVANAQANMTAGGGKLTNMTAGGGNMTAGGGNMTKANMTAGPIRSAISNATK
jgi:hypothetical protein